MHPILLKTFGGLSKKYYIRQFLFGLLFPVGIYFVMMGVKSSKNGGELPASFIVYLVINQFLYPYSRFVYESVVGYVMGDNVFFVNAVSLIFIKYLSMSLCYMFAIFLAPIGLIYLYFHHSKKSN